METFGLATALDAALAHHEAGRLAEAKALYDKILSQNPDDADALNLLGVLLQDTGELQQSIRLLSQAVAVDPLFAEAFTNLARAQCAAGDPAGARASSERAIALDPDLGEAHLQLTRALLALDDNDAALAAARRAAALAPGSADAQLFLGHAFSKVNDFTSAEAAYRTADQLIPDQIDTVLQLGLTLIELRQTDEAVKTCRHAAALAPDNAAAHAALGRALQRAKDIAGSIDAFQRALELAPDQPDVLRQQGDNFSLVGRFQSAADCYNRVLALGVDASAVFSALATIGKLSDATHARETLFAVLSDQGRPERERAMAGFALGALLDESGDYEAAFRTYHEANQVARGTALLAGEGFDAAQFRRQIDQLRTTFVPEFFATTRTWGDPSDLPVFIVGMPRSGTSLVEQILASHPRVRGGGERKDIFGIVGTLKDAAPGLAPVQWDPDTVLREAEQQLARLRSVGGPCDRFIDKLPDNLLLLGYIAMLFPNARVILCRRDPRDVCLSCYFQLFGDGVSWAFNLDDCAARTQEIERLTAHWRSVLPLRMLEVDYETLIGDLEGESRRMIDFLGLEWDDDCLAFHATERAVHTASFWQVRQPLYSTSVGRWRHYRPYIQQLQDGLIGLIPDRDDAMPTPVVLTMAGLHLAAGRLAAAESAYRLVIRRDSANADALGGLGRLLLTDGDATQAISLLKRADASRPDDTDILIELSRAHRSAGALAAAAGAAARVVALNPADAPAQCLLGCIQLDLGDPVAARDALERAIKLDPDLPNAHLNLGMACMRLTAYPAAATAMREAARLKPDDPECLAKLGWVLSQMGEHEQAQEYLHRALELAPEDGRVHLGVVMARWDLEDVAGAQAACDKGLLVAPGMAELWLHDGYCKAALGRFAEAAESYRKALALKPSIEEARLALIQAGFREESRVEINHLQRVLEDPDREEFQRTAAAFALGKLFDDDGDYDAAFAAFATGNRLVRSSNEIKGRGFDRAADDAHVRGLIAMFSPSVFQVTAGLGSPSELPVFVVGMPRSGTTLVEQILSSHSDVVGAGELDDVASIAARLAGGRKHLPLYEWRRSDVTREATNYVKKLGDVGVTAWRVVDKMPGNMQWLGHIAVLFPRARVIICRRDPRDVCLSCYFQHFGDKLSWSTDLGDLAAYAQSFDRLAAHWRSALPIRMLEVQYEDLVNDLETGSRRIIDFLGLEWDPACLSFHETERTVMTASQWQVRQPLYTSSVGRWRLYRKHLGPLLDGLRGLLLPEGDDPHQQHKTDGLSIDDLLQGGRVLTGGSVGAV